MASVQRALFWPLALAAIAACQPPPSVSRQPPSATRPVRVDGGTAAGGGGGPAEQEDAAAGAGGAGAAGGSVDGPTPPDTAARSDVGAGVPADARVDTASPAGQCPPLPIGSVIPCSTDPITGTPSQRGYLAIKGAGAATQYVCATSWMAGRGYDFAPANAWSSDSTTCCSNMPRTVPFPAAPLTPAGYLGRPHGPTQIKPQELANGKDSDIRQNPFAVLIVDEAGGQALARARANWQTWSSNGQAQMGADGSGPYYFPNPLIINYTVMQDTANNIVLVVGPEVATTRELKQTLGHPTLGACRTMGGAPLCLMGGEIRDTTLTNDSGRFGVDPSVTPEALLNAAKLFNARGVPITGTAYRASP